MKITATKNKSTPNPAQAFAPDINASLRISTINELLAIQEASLAVEHSLEKQDGERARMELDAMRRSTARLIKQLAAHHTTEVQARGELISALVVRLRNGTHIALAKKSFDTATPRDIGDRSHRLADLNELLTAGTNQSGDTNQPTLPVASNTRMVITRPAGSVALEIDCCDCWFEEMISMDTPAPLAACEYIEYFARGLSSCAESRGLTIAVIDPDWLVKTAIQQPQVRQSQVTQTRLTQPIAQPATPSVRTPHRAPARTPFGSKQIARYAIGHTLSARPIAVKLADIRRTIDYSIDDFILLAGNSNAGNLLAKLDNDLLPILADNLDLQFIAHKVESLRLAVKNSRPADEPNIQLILLGEKDHRCAVPVAGQIEIVTASSKYLDVIHNNDIAHHILNWQQLRNQFDHELKALNGGFRISVPSPGSDHANTNAKTQ